VNHDSPKRVHVAQESGDKRVGRSIVDFVGRTNLSDDAMLNYCNSVRHRECFFAIVSHIQGCDAKVIMNTTEFNTQLLSKPSIKCSKRFIQQQNRRLENHRASYCHPLLLPTTQLTWIPAFKTPQSHQIDNAANSLTNLIRA
jgi:hypothetical protein